MFIHTINKFYMILYLFFIGLVSLLFVVEYFYKEEGYSYLTVFSILVIILFVVILFPFFSMFLEM